MQRRQFLGSTAVLGSAALAGQMEGVDVDVRSDGGPETPSVPVDASDGQWAVDDERSGTFSDSMMGISSRGTTVAYADEGLSRELREKTLGEDVGVMRYFFASRVEYRPSVDNLPFGIGRGVVLNATRSNARDRFQDRLADAGLEEIERSGTRSVEIEGGPTTELQVYDAVYPFEGIEFEAGDSTVTIDGDALAVEGLLAVWYSETAESTLVAGAVNPAENYRESVRRELSDAVELTLDVDLGLTPEAYREETLDLIRGVQ